MRRNPAAKRALSLFLSLVLICSMLPSVALAAETTTDEHGVTTYKVTSFDDFTEAVDAAKSGAVVIDLQEDITMSSETSIAADGYSVTLTSSAGKTLTLGAKLTIDSGDVTLRDITVVGSGTNYLSVTGGTTTVEDVVITGATYGLYLNGSSSDPKPTVTIKSGVIQGTTSSVYLNRYAALTVSPVADIEELVVETYRRAANIDLKIEQDQGHTIKSNSTFNGEDIALEGGTRSVTLGTNKTYTLHLEVENPDNTSAHPIRTITKSSMSNGTVTVQSGAKAGHPVTVTATPNEGYALGTLTITQDGGSAVTASGTGNSRTFTMPAANVTVSATFAERSVATPTFSSAAGNVLNGTAIALSCTTAGASIYYTTDNSDFSTETWTLYRDDAKPIIDNYRTTTLRAIGVKEGLENSTVASAKYSATTPSKPTVSLYKNGTDGDRTTSNVDLGTYTVGDNINVTLKVKATGTLLGTLSYRWCSYTSSGGWKWIEGATEDSYTIPESGTAAATADISNGKVTYACTVTNTNTYDGVSSSDTSPNYSYTLYDTEPYCAVSGAAKGKESLTLGVGTNATKLNVDFRMNRPAANQSQKTEIYSNTTKSTEGGTLLYSSADGSIGTSQNSVSWTIPVETTGTSYYYVKYTVTTSDGTTYTAYSPAWQVDVVGRFYDAKVDSTLQNATLALSGNQFGVGQTVYVYLSNVKADYELSELYYTDSSGKRTDINMSTRRFTMPEDDVTVSAMFAKADIAAITVSSDGNGSAVAAPSSAEVGEVVAIGTQADSGYELASATVNGSAATVLGSVVTFTMPSGAANVVLTFREKSTADLTISTATELQTFANAVNSGTNYAGQVVRLANDVDLSGVCGSGVGSWVSIGTSNNPFKGTFDGEGHAINSLYASYSGDASGALFGVIDGAVVKNLTVSGSVECKQYAAAICNTAQNGSVIDSCTNLATVKATRSYAGGIAATVTKSLVANCVNNAAVSDGSHGGASGVVYTATGYNSAPSVYRCVNRGAISGKTPSSGVGYRVDYGLECVNYGRVSDTYGGGSGLFGRALKVVNCYNAGSVNNGVLGSYSYKDVTSSTGSEINEVLVKNCYSRSESATYPLLYAGYEVWSPIVRNSYYVTPASEGVSSNYGTVKTADELKAMAATLGEAYVADTNSINDGYPILAWQAGQENQTVTFKFSGESDPNAAITRNGANVTSVSVIGGQSVVFAVTTGTSYKVDSVTVGDQTLTANSNGNYSFTVTSDCTVSVTIAKKAADEIQAGANSSLLTGSVPASQVWDGVSVDVSWYIGNEGASSYTISTAAQLMGVAALVNGLVNEDCLVYVSDTEYMTAADWNKSDYVKVSTNSDSGAGGNNLSTDTYYYGVTDFNGKTITLTANIDMGGVYDFESDTWSGPNYMPIGGQYLMTKNDSSTKIGSSFCGTLDGGGHYVYNIYCDRHCETGNYGDGSSVGLIGRLGVHDSDDASLRPVNPTVENIGVTGYIYGNRSVGGIVGKIGKTSYKTATPPPAA